MATTSSKSLVARAGAAARKVVSRGAAASPAEEEPVAQKTAQKTAQKAPAKSAKKTATRATKPPAKKTSTKKAATKKATAKKSPAKKTSSTAKAPAKKTATKAATKTPTKAPAKKASTKASAKAGTKTGTRRTGRAAPSSLAVLDQESPWTAAELASVRKQLDDDVVRLTAELAAAEHDLAGMIENSNDGAGNDQADVGSASFERDQEMVVVNNAREMLVQSRHALERIDEGTYGKCESCGSAIGKNRLMAFPRATLCLACKQREERR